MSGWDPVPLVLVPAAAALALFLHGLVRLRRRGRPDLAGRGRVVPFVAGLACAVLPLVSPLDALGDRSLLSAHMAEHMLLGDAAPALLLLALRGPLLVFVVPAGVLGACARLSPLRAALAGLLRPSVSLCVWTGALALWHVPASYDFALRHPLVHAVEHACFFAAGMLVWTQLVDPARHRRLSVSQRLGYAGALFVLGQLLGNLLLLSQPLYPAYTAVTARPLGWSALEDQQFAGVVMMGEQLLTLGTCAFLLLRSLVAPVRDQAALGEESSRPRPAGARMGASFARRAIQSSSTSSFS